MSHCIDPTTLHGFLPNSRFSDLFVKIFHLTAPRKENEDTDLTNVISDTSEQEQEVQVPKSDEVEDGEISDDDDGVEELLEDKVSVKLSQTVLNKVSKKSKKRGKALAKEKQMAKKMLKSISLQPGQPCSLTLPLSSQFSLDSSPERVSWLHQLLAFMERRGTPVTSSPSQPQLLSPGPDIPKLPLDLYKLYNTVSEHGGGAACTANQGWREVAGLMELPVQKFFLVKKMYERYLLPFEEAKVTSVIIIMATSRWTNNCNNFRCGRCRSWCCRR